MARIKSFLSAMGHLIESAQLKEEMNASKRSASAYHSLALAISEIGKPNSRHETVGDGIPFSSVLRDVANLFDSSLSQLFLCEPREITKGRGFEIARHVIGTSLRENTRFLEPTHKERFPKRLLAQKLTAPRVIVVDTGTGLTASAVKTLKPVTSPNVSDDPFWSGTELELTGLRAFMGLPLYFETDDQIVVYGVLTLTRLRYRQGDSRDFSVEEVQTGQNIAALLTSAFRQRHEFQRITDAADEVTLRVKRCLRWFRHDIPAMVSDIEDEARACRALARGRKSERLLDLAVLSEATRSVFVACALALGERADKHADGSANHVLEIKQMKEQLDALLRRDSKRGDTSVEINVVPTNVVRVFGVLEKPLMYCAFALLQNGVVACYHNRVHTSGQHPGRVILTLDFSLSDTLKLTVLDDAGGVGEHTLDELTIEQKSGWPSMPTGRGQSTGMGLYIVKRLVGEHLNGMLQVQNKEWSGRTGALFTVTVPYTSLE
jgi:signal transduction histidine kinase